MPLGRLDSIFASCSPQVCDALQEMNGIALVLSVPQRWF